MTAQFPTKRVVNLGYDLNFGRMIKLRILDLMHDVLVVDRVGRKMNEIGGIIAK